MRHAITLTLLHLRRLHGPGYVRRLSHAGVRPRLSQTIMYATNGDAHLLYATPGGTVRQIKIIGGDE